MKRPCPGEKTLLVQRSSGPALSGSIGLISLALVVGSVVAAQGATVAGGRNARDQTPPPAAPAAVVPEYRIAPGDVLKILVWKEPELSTEAFVRLDGRITVPLVGDTVAANRTPDELSREIEQKLGRFIEIPKVTLGVSQAVSARFYVLGEVRSPGAFPLPSRITVLQALALAGGFREFAKRESILIVRRAQDQQVAVPVNYKDLEAGLHLEQNIFLESGDTILVP